MKPAPEITRAGLTDNNMIPARAEKNIILEPPTAVRPPGQTLAEFVKQAILLPSLFHEF